jgi:hypothetical protein
LHDAIEFFQSGSDDRSRSGVGGSGKIVLQVIIYTTDAPSLSGSSSQATGSRRSNGSQMASSVGQPDHDFRSSHNSQRGRIAFYQSTSQGSNGHSADISDALESLQIQDSVRPSHHHHLSSERDRNEEWVQDQRKNSLPLKLGATSQLSPRGRFSVRRDGDSSQLARSSQPIRRDEYNDAADSAGSSAAHDSGFGEFDRRHRLEPVSPTPKTVCSRCRSVLHSLKYVCKDCRKNTPTSDKGKSRGVGPNGSSASHPMTSSSYVITLSLSTQS